MVKTPWIPRIQSGNFFMNPNLIVGIYYNQIIYIGFISFKKSIRLRMRVLLGPRRKEGRKKTSNDTSLFTLPSYFFIPYPLEFP